MGPGAIAGTLRLRVGVDMGAVAAGLEQREAYRVLAGQEGAAGEAIAVADDPITLPAAFDVEVVGRADMLRDKSGHCDNGVCFHDARIKGPDPIKFRAQSYPAPIKMP